MKPEFASIFDRLRRILQKYAGALTLTVEVPDHYCLPVAHSPELKKGFPAACVKIEKAYVSCRFMPVCVFPKLRDGLSKQLWARMQGKSCFNFKSVNEALFGELEALTTRGFDVARKAGLGPGRKADS